MNNKLDLVSLLKHAPIGYKLFCERFGNGYFRGVKELKCGANNKLPAILVEDQNHIMWAFSKSGAYFNPSMNGDEKCELFPTDAKRNWDGVCFVYVEDKDSNKEWGDDYNKFLKIFTKRHIM